VYRQFKSLMTIAVASLSFIAGSVQAQTPARAGNEFHVFTNTSGTGTTNKVPKWTDGVNGVLGDSSITDVNGDIGVGIALPNRKLHVNGIFRADDMVESRKGGSDTLGAGSGFWLGNSAGDLAGVQLSANSDMDFYMATGGWKKVMQILFSNGNVGINTGTTGPVAKLDVTAASGGGLVEGIKLNADGSVFTSGAGVFIGGPRLSGSDTFRMGGVVTPNQFNLFFSTWDGLAEGLKERLRLTGDGKLGLNVTDPQALVHFNWRAINPIGVNVRLGDYANYGSPYSSWATVIGNNVKAKETQENKLAAVYYRANTASDSGAAIVIDRQTGFTFQTMPSPGATPPADPVFTTRMSIDMNGAVNVPGSVTVGGTLTATQVIGAVYQDVAEWVPATTHMAPGTVVVLNREHNNEVMPSASAYDTAVAGVVSAQPGLILGVGSDSKAQIATTGRVKVHVDATAAPIARGDLLVTGNKPGTAMKSQPVDLGGVPIHRPGTVIGKALEPLQGGEGEILVLLSLQ